MTRWFKLIRHLVKPARYLALIIPTIVLLLGTVRTTQALESFRIIVNTVNPTVELSSSDVSRLFLKKDKTWDNSDPVLPVDQVTTTQTRSTFSQKIHNKSVNAVKNYWQQQIFSGRGVPPAEKKSDAEIVSYVENNPGAVGYVSLDADLGKTKVLRIAD